MNKKTLIIAGVAIIIIILAIWGINASKNTSMPQANTINIGGSFDAVSSFTVAKPNFVIKGKGLSRIEVWAVPTGTNISESDIKSLGTPTLQSTDNGTETWILPIPHAPLAVTDIYVIGYDKDNKAAGSVDLGVTGATEIYNAVWGKGASSGTSTNTAPSTSGAGGMQTSTSNPLRTLRVGESATFGGLSLTLKSITEDSRCPKGVYCIQAGKLAGTLETTVSGKTSTEQFDSTKTITVNGYAISVDSIDPLPVGGQKDFSKYIITFRIKQG